MTWYEKMDFEWEGNSWWGGKNMLQKCEVDGIFALDSNCPWKTKYGDWYRGTEQIKISARRRTSHPFKNIYNQNAKLYGYFSIEDPINGRPHEVLDASPNTSASI